MQRTLPEQFHRAAENRGGVTLTEVLMSMMIMSIGVSAVAVLFPISVLRSIQATQMTNGAILKYNTEALVRMRPELVFDPDGDRFTNPAFGLIEHVSSPLERRYIVDPGGYFALTDAGASFSGNPTLPNGSSDRLFADWVGNVDTNSDGIPEQFDDSVAGRTPLPRYDGGIRWSTRSGARPFGFDPNPTGPNPDEARALQFLASNISKLGDGWITQLDSTAEALIRDDGAAFPAQGGIGPGNNIVGVQIPADADLTAFPDGMTNVPRAAGVPLIPDPELYRVTLFSNDGKFSVSLPITRIAGQQIFWGEDATTGDLNLNGTQDIRALPNEFLDRAAAPPLFFTVGRVLVQTQRPNDFNWLLTVRRGSDGEARGIDVVVTFNKNVAIEDERLYSSRFGQGAASAGGSGNELFEEIPPTSTDPFRVNVALDGGLFENGDPAEPLLKRGGYLLDMTNARWYRIQDYQKTTFDDGAGNPIDGFIVRTETPITGGVFTTRAMFLPGVVDVYPMGSLNLPPEFDL
jgi:prepilin-type N-terminal cleavage/methylation domain-containing protein